MSQSLSNDEVCMETLDRRYIVKKGVDVYENADALIVSNVETVVVFYECPAAAASHEIRNTNKRRIQQVQTTESLTAGSRSCRLAGVCLGVLCVLLLAAITVLWIMVTAERDQLLTSNTNLTKERDQLLTNYTNLTIERDQLLTNYTNLSIERDQLQTSYTNLSKERDQLLTNYTKTVQFQKEREVLHSLLSELGWRYFNSSLYYITSENNTWFKSQQHCKDKGGDLVIINSREEQEFITAILKGTEAWIGLTDEEKEGHWRWVDGSALTTGFWWPGEPNNFENKEDCAVTGFKHVSSTNASTWADYDCHHPVVGLCERTFRLK
ncbi:uncharacterized protein [Salminus brasiliensis]|uniref:uncharacterized protein n=1 Tax=Salminus brasiliensis TaxID=930266 RepID=UPI003B831030